MKHQLLFLIICAAILVSPVNNEIRAVDDTSSSGYLPAAIEFERVYGIDYSHQIFDTVSLDSFRNFIIKLTENGSRPIGAITNLGENNVAARNWIANELRAVSKGRIQVEILGHYNSVVGKLPGYLPVDAPALMVGGHYDSVADSPGANDDGTGIAAALELARVLSRYNWPLDIYFGAWNAEENGLLGSTEVSQIMRDRNVKLLAYYNIDMLLVPGPYAPRGGEVLMAYPEGAYHQGNYWADLTRVMSQNYGQHMIQPISSEDFSGWERSDHWPFIVKGYTALFAHERGFAYDVAYHTAQDVWNNPLYNYEVATEVVRAIGSSMAFTMARAYEKPTVQNVSFTLPKDDVKNYTFAISTPTTVNVIGRWFGGGTSISLYNPNDQLLAQMVDTNASAWEYTQIFNQSVTSKGIYRLQITNEGKKTVGHEISLSYETDIDGNGIQDSAEFWFDQEYFSLDTDSDSLSDGFEMIIGTLRDSADSDIDNLPDAWEIEHGLNPLDPNDATEDNDSDGVINVDEYLYNCDPNNPDSDSDNMPDLWEIDNDLNPTMDDSLEDPDHDDFTNIQEYIDGTDPHYAEFRPRYLVVPTIVIGAIAAIVMVTYWKIRPRT